MTSSTGKPIIAVCGATGFQGGSVVKHLLRDGKFAIRALTRKPSSAQAKAIASLGVEVVQADFDDLPSLRGAFRGCYGVFAVTDYYDAYERETQQGFNIVDAAKSEGIKHIIMSAADVIEGDPPMLEQKAKVAAYLRQSGVPCTVFITMFYYGNIFLIEALKRDPKTGGWRFYLTFPTDIPIPSVSPRDIGAYILAGFNNPSEWIGRDMRLASEYVSPRQYAETFAEVTGMPVEIREFTREEFFALKNEPFTLEAWTVFKWWIDMHDGVLPQLDVDLAHRLCPNLQTWRDYALEHVEVPPEQPSMLIQCYQTQEHFTENPGGKKNAP